MNLMISNVVMEYRRYPVCMLTRKNSTCMTCIHWYSSYNYCLYISLILEEDYYLLTPVTVHTLPIVTSPINTNECNTSLINNTVLDIYQVY